MAQAKELLKTTDLNLQRIAELCGYRESSNFSFAFKKIEGIGPGLWRKGSGLGCGAGERARAAVEWAGSGCGGGVRARVAEEGVEPGLWRKGK